MPDQRGCNGKPLCPPSQPPHEYGPGIRPKDATDKEARTPRSRGRSVVVLYNGVRTHRSLNKDAPVSRSVQRAGVISSRAVLGGLHHRTPRVVALTLSDPAGRSDALDRRDDREGGGDPCGRCAPFESALL